MNRTILIAGAVLSTSSLLLVDSAIKGGTLLVLAALVALLLRRDSAATRHLVWQVSIVGMLGVPVFSAVLPQWRVLPAWAVIPGPDSGSSLNSASASTRVDAVDTDPVEVVGAAPVFESRAGMEARAATFEPSPVVVESNVSEPAFSHQPAVERAAAEEAVDVASAILPEPARPDGSVIQLLPILWLIGFSALMLRLLAARVMLWSGERRGTVIAVSQKASFDVRPGDSADSSSDAAIFDAFRTACQQVGVVRPVRLLLHGDRTIPVVWGILRHRLLLPEAARAWTPEQLQSVLLHELAHIKRCDAITQLLAQVACALHWFNPLVWFAACRLHVERERACDDLVLASGVRPSAYAEHLLHVATRLAPARWTQACGLAMARKSSLEGRLNAVLSEKLNRRSVPAAVGVAALIVGIGIAVPVAMLHATDAATPDAATPAVEPAVGDLDPVPETVPLISDVAQGLLPSATTSEEREQVLQRLESLGLSRRQVFDIDPQRKPLPHVYQAHLWDVPQAAWPLLGSLYMTRELDMTASRVSPEAFRHIAGMRALQELVVMNSSFEAEHLAALAPLNRLKKIDVMFSVFQRSSEERRKQVGELTAEEQARFDEIAGPDQRLDHIAEAAILTDRAMSKLSGLTELETLRLVNTFVSNVGLQSLKQMQQLEDVEISCGGSITLESASVFGSLPKLRKLELGGTIDADAAEGLKPALALKELELRSIDDGVAAVVAELPKLERLRLWASSLSDDGLLKLAELEHLKHLDIRNSHRGTLTQTGIEKFQAARPGCVVMHDLRVESLVERNVPLPADHFVVRVHWRKATSRQQLAEHMQTRFGKSEHWVEFRPLTRAGYVGGMALVRGGEAGRDWLLAQIGADGDYDVSYAEPLSYKRLKDEGVFFDALLKPGRTSPAKAETPATKPDHPSGSKASATDTSESRSILLPGEVLPPFQELLARLRESGQGATADGLQARFDSQIRWNSASGRLARRTNSVIAYGQVVATTGEPPQLCNAPMTIFEGGWFVAGIGELDRPVGFRMFGCRPVDVVASKIVPAVEHDSVISLGQIVMEPYAESELATLRGRLKFATDNMSTGIRARVIISEGPTNSITGGTDGYLEWPEKENVTLTSDLQFEHRRLAPLPHRLHIEIPGHRSVSRNLDLTPGATLDLGTIEIEVAPTFRVELLTSDTSDFTESKARSVTVPLGEVWKSNPDNEALRKYSGGDMRFTTFPIDRRQPDGEHKLVIHSGVAFLKLADLGTGELEDFRETSADPPKLRYTRDISIQSGHVYLGYHTHWKHWTLLRVTIE